MSKDTSIIIGVVVGSLICIGTGYATASRGWFLRRGSEAASLPFTSGFDGMNPLKEFTKEKTKEEKYKEKTGLDVSDITNDEKKIIGKEIGETVDEITKMTVNGVPLYSMLAKDENQYYIVRSAEDLRRVGEHAVRKGISADDPSEADRLMSSGEWKSKLGNKGSEPKQMSNGWYYWKVGPIGFFHDQILMMSAI